MKKTIPHLAYELKQDSSNFHYLSIIEYRRENFLGVIDNITPTEITAFTLDFAEQAQINVKDFLSVVNYWFYSGSSKYPLSFEIAKLGLTETFAPLLRVYDTDNVSRIVGCPFQFEITPAKHKIKRRRVVFQQQVPTVKLKRSNKMELENNH